MNEFYGKLYNPDVLTCLANLSNDEVFTPPEVANRMLDMLPEELWHDSGATFLDPACKSGVFLREIAKRLIEGLKGEIPDLQERVNHIFHKQLFGIAITELTGLLSRRSVYCSKYPNSKYSIVLFEDASGNIRYKRTQHQWHKGKCVFCGASQCGKPPSPAAGQLCVIWSPIRRPAVIHYPKKTSISISHDWYVFVGSQESRPGQAHAASFPK